MSMNVIERKEIRGKLIDILYGNYGRSWQVSSLVNAFVRKIPTADTEIPTQLRYLADPQKGFVTFEYDGEPALTPTLEASVQLTARGCNLWEGDIDDPGVIFGDGRRA